MNADVPENEPKGTNQPEGRSQENQNSEGHEPEKNGAPSPAKDDPIDRLPISEEEKAELRQWKAEKDALMTPEFLTWARAQFNEEEFLAGMREIEETGGVDFATLMRDIDQILGSNE